MLIANFPNLSWSRTRQIPTKKNLITSVAEFSIMWTLLGIVLYISLDIVSFYIHFFFFKKGHLFCIFCQNCMLSMRSFLSSLQYRSLHIIKLTEATLPARLSRIIKDSSTSFTDDPWGMWTPRATTGTSNNGRAENIQIRNCHQHLIRKLSQTPAILAIPAIRAWRVYRKPTSPAAEGRECSPTLKPSAK